MSVIEIWLMGGPSSLETFDPKPDAPKDVSNGLGALRTESGFAVHAWLPKLAKCSRLYSVVRTLTHAHGGHETAVYLMQTGQLPGGRNVAPAIGSLVAREMSVSGRYRGDLPPSVILTQPKGRFSEVGFLGHAWEPLVTGGDPNGRIFSVDGITPAGGLSPAAREKRATLAEALDDFPVRIAEFESAGAEAKRIMSGSGAKAFDLSTEPKELRDAYGRNKFGQSLLVARRLVEYGVPYITVNLAGWDTHKRHFDAVPRLLAQVDAGLSALLADLEAHDLLKTTLVWSTGEFGRTPRIAREAPWNGGRHHFPNCFSALVAGGGLAGGQAVGESDACAERPVRRPVTPQDFLGTICERCGLDADRLLGRTPRRTLREIYA